MSTLGAFLLVLQMKIRNFTRRNANIRCTFLTFYRKRENNRNFLILMTYLISGSSNSKSFYRRYVELYK
jgi:hypothetical protein